MRLFFTCNNNVSPRNFNASFLQTFEETDCADWSYPNYMCIVIIFSSVFFEYKERPRLLINFEKEHKTKMWVVSVLVFQHWNSCVSFVMFVLPVYSALLRYWMTDENFMTLMLSATIIIFVFCLSFFFKEFRRGQLFEKIRNKFFDTCT